MPETTPGDVVLLAPVLDSAPLVCRFLKYRIYDDRDVVVAGSNVAPSVSKHPFVMVAASVAG
jgi:hypothetical protein